jgi:hypothetical protein
VKKITLLFLICFTPFVNAEPITFLKLNWSMSLDEMLQTIRSYGAKCDEKKINSMVIGYDCKKGIWDFIELTKDYDPYIKFYCGSYKGCKTDVHTMADLIAKNYGIKMYKDDLLVKLGEKRTEYCGTASEGDRICLIEGKYARRHHVELWKGTFGGPKPSF